MRFIIATVGVLLTLTTPLAGAEIDLPKPNQKWIELTTTNFRFFSNAGRSATKRVAIDLEELRAVLTKLSDFELQAPIPTQIYVFRNDRSFEPYKIRHDGEPASISGYFSQQPEGNYIAVAADVPRASRVVFHEYVHFIAANNFGELPVWLSEGLAEFYETFEVVGRTVYIGLPIRSHLLQLRGSLPIPLSELLVVDHDSPLYNEAERRGDLYAESWALTHYLLLGNHDRRRQLVEYLGLLRNGATYEDAFTTAFGSDLEQLERELKAHLRDRRIPHIETRAEIDLENRVEIREMSHSEVLFRLGDLLANLTEVRPERLAFFEAAVAADPLNGQALSALAVEAEMRADWTAALDLHRRSLESDPDDPLVLYRWGRFLVERGTDFQTGLEALERSTRLDPSFGPAWVALADALAEAGVTDRESVETVETAHRLLPTDLRVSKNLVRVYLRLDRRSDAVRLVETSFRSRPDLRALGWGMIFQRDLLTIRELLRDGLLDEAAGRLTLAEQAIEMTGNPMIHHRSLEVARTAINDAETAIICAEAENLYASGDAETATAMLESAAAAGDTGPVAAACRRLAATIRRAENPSPPPTEEVTRTVTRGEVDRLNQLLAESDLLGALEFLEGLRPGLSGESLFWVDDKIREIEGTVRYNRYIDDYNRAVDLYNAEKYSAAISLLEELISTLAPGQQAAFAQALLDDARNALQAQ